MRDLVDIFGSSSDAAPQPDDLWDAVKSPGDVTTDPWDSVGVCRVTASDLCRLFRLSLFYLSLKCLLTDVHSSTPVNSCWMPPPTSSDTPHPWPPHPDTYKGPWDVEPGCTRQDVSSPRSASPTGTEADHLGSGEASWMSSSSPPPPCFSSSPVDTELFRTKVNADPFTAANSMPDPFGEDPLLSPQINGLESSPEMSDLSRLAPPLGAPSARLCRTPEAFLGPTGASLVNLDALIPSNPPTKMHKNPFLSGSKK